MISFGTGCLLGIPSPTSPINHPKDQRGPWPSHQHTFASTWTSITTGDLPKCRSSNPRSNYPYPRVYNEESRIIYWQYCALEQQKYESNVWGMPRVLLKMHTPDVDNLCFVVNVEYCCLEWLQIYHTAHISHRTQFQRIRENLLHIWILKGQLETLYFQLF